jgi:hypothetical protein
MAHAFAYANAFHQHRNDEAAAHLETCLSFANHVPAAMRAALASDASVFQARRCRRVELAEQWAADIGAAATPWLRWRAEAAILEAKGDAQGALGKLEACERAVAAGPRASQREYVLRILRRWESELGGE